MPTTRPSYRPPIQRVSQSVEVIKIRCMSTQPFVYRAFRFVNQKLLRNTWEDSIAKVQSFTSIKSSIAHSLKYRMRTKLTLAHPNQAFTFPLASRYTHQDKTFNTANIYMTIKHAGVGGAPMTTPQVQEINRSQDRSRAATHVMDFVRTLRAREMEQLEKIWSNYVTKDVVYSKSREVIFAQSILNGQYPFLVRKLRHDQFDIEDNRPVQEAYLRELESALTNEELSSNNLQSAGISAEQLRERIAQGDAYCILFEDLEQISKAKLLANRPTIVMGNESVGEEYFLQAPFAVFLRVDGHFLNVANGFRYTLDEGQKAIRFFSPFFKRQSEAVWRLSQSHLGSAMFNDFQWRVHLGEFHFSTEQFNVPIYNYLTNTTGPKHNLETFFKYGFSTFNPGLESTNALISSSAIRTVQDYSPIVTTVNLTKEHALEVMANHANRLNFAHRSPMDLVIKNGITEEAALKDFEQFGLHFRLYRIMAKHLQNIWNIFDMKSQARTLMVAINKEIDNMVVNGGQRRPYIKQEEVLPLLTNIVYTWVGYHANTFSGLVSGNYWNFRPSMLKKEVPYEAEEWGKVVPGEEMPHAKVILEGLKLTNLTAQRDSDYTLLSIMRKQAFAVREEIDMGMAQDLERHKQLLTSLEEVADELKKFDEEVNALIQERQAAEKIDITWLNPSDMQSGINT